MSSFYLDVIRLHPRFDTTDRVSDMLLLEPVTRAAVLAIVADAKAIGQDLLIFETYRSQARQEVLFQRGATQLRNVGTHHMGIAADLVRVVAGQPTWQGDYTFLGRLAKKHGLVWGGDWGQPGVAHDFVDSDHVQRCSLHDQPRLLALEFYPDTLYNPLVHVA